MRVLHTEYLNLFMTYPWYAQFGLILLLISILGFGICLIVVCADVKYTVFAFSTGFSMIMATIVLAVSDPIGWQKSTNVVDYREVIFEEDFKESADYLELMRTYEVDEIKGDIWVLKPRERMVDE